MSSDLNLLPSQAKFRAKRMRLRAKITNFLWIFVGVWISVVILVMGIFLILNLVASQTNKNYQKDLNQYKVLLGSMSVNQKVKYQAKVVGKVLESRFKYGDVIEQINNLFYIEVNMDNMEIKSKNDFVINGSMVNGENMDSVEETVGEINQGLVDGFESAKLNAVKFDPKFGWSFVVEVMTK